MTAWIRRHKIVASLLIVIGAFLLILLSMALIPVHVQSPSAPNPAASYEDALARIEEIQSQEAVDPEINPTCYTRLLTHDQKVDPIKFGLMTSYGLGVGVFPLVAAEAWGHNGGTAGFATLILTIPEKDAILVHLANSADCNIALLPSAIQELLLDG